MYFSVFDQMILQQKKEFSFQGRNKRPPMDNVNALLSFIYTLLTNNIVSALECVGLDPYVGYLHTDRPGRASLALDLIEEFRAVLADRFVLSLINKKIVSGKGFVQKENGAVLMNEELRKKILTEWQNKKKESHYPSVSERENRMGHGPLCAGNASGQISSGRSGWISGIFVEVRWHMLVLITYDVNTETAAGKNRLRKVAKQCVNYGRRVQNSVFECILDQAQCTMLKAILSDLIDENTDSLRFYYLGNKYKTKVEHIGVDRGIAADQTLIL